MAYGPERSLSPDFKRIAPLIAALPGRILDAPCGQGRHAFYLQKIGCRLTCVDLDQKRLDFVESKDKFFELGLSKLVIYRSDLKTIHSDFPRGSFSAVISVHFFEHDVLVQLAELVVVGGLLYFESVENRKGNFEQLPEAAEITDILGSNFDLLYLTEKAAGPIGSSRVTVRLLARRLAKPGLVSPL